MRVLLINDYPPGHAKAGGAEGVVVRTRDLLAARGIDVRLFTCVDVPGHHRGPLRYISNEHAAAALTGTLRCMQPDVVHLHNYYHELSPAILKAAHGWRESVRAMGAAGPRIVMTAHDFHLVCPSSGLVRWTGRRLEPALDAGEANPRCRFPMRWDHRGWRWSALKSVQHWWNYRVRKRWRAIDLVMCPSRFLGRLVKAAGLATAYVPLPVHTTAQTESIRAEHGEQAGGGRQNDRLALVFAGRLEIEKGLADWLRIVPLESAWTLDVIGDGTERERCEGLCAARRIGERVVFHGRLPHEQTLERIARAHALVLPSRCPENAPMSIAEALSVRTNVLAADQGGMQEMVRDAGVGTLFTLDDSESLRRAMQALERQRVDGSLNAFDVSAFLRTRTEERYIDALLAVFRGETVGEREGRP